MGLFRKEAIKSGQGSEEVKRFFLLVSALFAYIENQPLPPNVPQNINEIIDGIKLLNNCNKFLEFLSGIRVAVDQQVQKMPKRKSSGYFILILNYESRRLKIIQFKTNQIEKATLLYNNIEKHRSGVSEDSVLVRVSSVKVLKSAYPNYFSDIGEFVNIVESYIK